MSLFGAGLVLSQVQSPWEEAFAASAGSGHGTQPREITCKQGAGHLALQVRVKQPPESRFSFQTDSGIRAVSPRLLPVAVN